jgi:hypothetical protein
MNTLHMRRAALQAASCVVLYKLNAAAAAWLYYTTDINIGGSGASLRPVTSQVHDHSGTQHVGSLDADTAPGPFPKDSSGQLPG